MNDVTLHRHKDGSLAIAHAPEVFLCARPSLELLVAGHNQAIAAGNDARSEITRLETELAKASGLQQTVTIASQTINDQSATIERLDHQLAEASDQVHNADLRADRAKRERDATAHALDKLRNDVKALLTETDQQQELHAFDRHIAHVQRKIDFFHKHQELLKPRHSHEDDAGQAAAPQPAMWCRDCGKPMTITTDSVLDTVIRWECPCGTSATRHKNPGEP